MIRSTCRPTYLSTYTKAPRGVAYNPLPPGWHCSSECQQRAHCYARRSLTYRLTAAAKLERTRNSLSYHTHRAAYELLALNPTPNILRVCSLGPLPRRPSRQLVAAMRHLVHVAAQLGVPVHFPVESVAKRDYWQSELPNVVVRLSGSVQQRVTDPGPVSMVAGESWESKTDRVLAARQAARLRHNATGRRCVVCPAIAGASLGHSPETRAKQICGRCTACCDRATDVVYPLH